MATSGQGKHIHVPTRFHLPGPIIARPTAPTWVRMYCSSTMRGADTRSSNSPPLVSRSSSVLASPVQVGREGGGEIG